MSRSRSARAALRRALVVLVVLSAALAGMAGTSLAVSVSETPSTSSSAVPPASGITGLSLGTVTWALVGITVLVLGFVAASLSGRRDPDAMHPSLAHAGAGHSFQPSTHEAQGEPTAAAVIV